MERLYPLQFRVNLQEKVWGGQRLKPLKGLQADDTPMGESWEVSAVEGKESIVSNGALQGQTLSQLTRNYGPLLLGKKVSLMYGDQFPLLLKLIDARDDLSIQVHPNDHLAQTRMPTFTAVSSRRSRSTSTASAWRTAASWTCSCATK